VDRDRLPVQEEAEHARRELGEHGREQQRRPEHHVLRVVRARAREGVRAAGAHIEVAFDEGGGTIKSTHPFLVHMENHYKTKQWREQSGPAALVGR
jgi:hypothetical protein